MRLLFFIVCAVLVSSEDSRNRFELNILHYNDFHARFVETDPWGSTCEPESAPCIGGFARLATVIRDRLSAEPHSVLLNGGDNFQGTIWYNLLRWNVTQVFMNMLPHDALVLGNHEFDNGIEGVVPYLQHINAPVVTANINDDQEPSIKGLYESSVIVEKNGRKVGIIGVILADTKNISTTGKLHFIDEVEAVKREAVKLNAEGVDIIVVLSHCGLDLDRKIAVNGGPYIDIIVGAHSHSLLYNGNPPHNSYAAEGPYPVVVNQGDRKVLIVQAAAHTQYLGEIKLVFDSAGNLLEWKGNPHYIGNDIKQAEDVLARISEYLPAIEEITSQKIGESLVHMPSNCTCSECLLGSFICDSYINAATRLAKNGTGDYAHFCVLSRGGIRADITEGVVTLESVISATPFENNIEVFELRGDHIMEILEYAVAGGPWPGSRMVQVSGLRAKFDGALPQGSRVLNVTIRCIECDVPRYEPLELEKYYRVVTTSFMGQGGDEFTMISENRRNLRVVGVDYVILMNYVKDKSPIFVELDGRIDVSNPCVY